MRDINELRKYFLLFLQWWWLIVLCTVLGGIAAFIVSKQTPPVYNASATLLINDSSDGAMSEYTALMTSGRLAQTYSEMLVDQPVLEQVIVQLALPISPGNLRKQVQVALVSNTQLIRLTVEDTDPARAVQIADAIANVFIAQIGALQASRYGETLDSMQAQVELLQSKIQARQVEIQALGNPVFVNEQTEIARLQALLAADQGAYTVLMQTYQSLRLYAMRSTSDVVISKTARTSGAPIRPNTKQNTMLAAVVGAMVAVGVVFLIEYLDDTLKTPDDVREALGLDTLGAIGQLKAGEEWVTLSHPLSPIVEAYRSLRTNIRYASIDKPLRTLLVTSAGASEGKSSTVVNLGTVMAQSGLQVVLVNADLRRPRLDTMLGLDPHDGLTESLLAGKVDGNLHAIAGVEHLRAVPTGEMPPNPAELLGSQRMLDVLAEIAAGADMVLIDTPPVLPVTDALVLAPSVDGVVLVVEAGKTRRGAAQRMVELMRQVGANLIGVVLAGIPANRGGYYYYYYYYQHHYYEDQDGKHNGHKRRHHDKNAVGRVWRLIKRRLKVD